MGRAGLIIPPDPDMPKGGIMAKSISTLGRPTHFKQIAIGVGIEVLGFDYGANDYVKWRWTGEKKVHRNIVYYTTKGRPYFKNNGSRHYLDEFMAY